jgi:hypothetical protein
MMVLYQFCLASNERLLIQGATLVMSQAQIGGLTFIYVCLYMQLRLIIYSLRDLVKRWSSMLKVFRQQLHAAFQYRYDFLTLVIYPVDRQ